MPVNYYFSVILGCDHHLLGDNQYYDDLKGLAKEHNLAPAWFVFFSCFLYGWWVIKFYISSKMISNIKTNHY